MRKKNREITELDAILKVVEDSQVCRLGLAKDGQPYVVPLNFGYEYKDGSLVLYFHGAKEGQKMDYMKSNSRVCIEMEGQGELLQNKETGKCTYIFESVIGFGEVEIVEDMEEKLHGLNLLMNHYAEEEKVHEFAENALAAVAVWKVMAGEFTGKRKES